MLCIELHITVIELFWCYCYRKLTFPFHKLCSPSIVTNIWLVTPHKQSIHCSRGTNSSFLCIACWNLNSSITCHTMVTFRSASAGENKVDELTEHTKHSYKLFSLLHSQSYILVWHLRSIYHMNHSWWVPQICNPHPQSLAWIFKISISWNTKCDNLVSFPKSGHIYVSMCIKH